MTNEPAFSTYPPGPRRPLTAEEEHWLLCAAHMAAAAKVPALSLYGTSRGRIVLGQGAGGDRTLEIDRACEVAMLEVLAREAPASYQVVSEEAGIAGASEARYRVIVDPLDGSLNAKRGLEPFCASIAIADGDSLRDVLIGYIEDFTRPRYFAAVRGAGLVTVPAVGAGTPPVAPMGDVQPAPVATFPDPTRFTGDLVEMVLLEAGRPDRHHFQYHELSAMGAIGRSRDMRIRQIGSLALSLCYVATGIADILVAGVRSRSVDVAAGMLILAEAGGGAAAIAGGDIWSQDLDLEKRCAFVAWRAGLDPAEIVSRARELGRTLLVHP